MRATGSGVTIGTMSAVEPPERQDDGPVAPGEEIVYAELHEVVPAAPSRMPAIKAAAVAAGSFAAGATVAMLAQALARRAAGGQLAPPAPRSPLAEGPSTGWPVVSSRRYIVDVHLFGE